MPLLAVPLSPHNIVTRLELGGGGACGGPPIHSLTGPVGQPFATCPGGQQFASRGCTHTHNRTRFSCSRCLTPQYTGFSLISKLPICYSILLNIKRMTWYNRLPYYCATLFLNKLQSSNSFFSVSFNYSGSPSLLSPKDTLDPIGLNTSIKCIETVERRSRGVYYRKVPHFVKPTFYIIPDDEDSPDKSIHIE
jgi:hypothetical protein